MRYQSWFMLQKILDACSAISVYFKGKMGFGVGFKHTGFSELPTECVADMFL